MQDQRPSVPEITASINLIGTADDTLPSPTCDYQWTIAQIDSINLNSQNIFLNSTNMMMGNAADGWGLTTTFPGFISGTFGEGFYYIALELSNCACAGDRKEEKVVGWRWNRTAPFTNDKEWQLDELSTARLQHFRNQLKTNK